MQLDSKQWKLAELSALASCVLVSETWLIFTYKLYVNIAECMVFKMRYAPAFNKFPVNSVVLFFMILFSWHNVIKKGHHEGYKVQRKFQERQAIDEEGV
jgi:hypothetical protein